MCLSSLFRGKSRAQKGAMLRAAYERLQMHAKLGAKLCYVAAMWAVISQNP